MLGVQLGVLIVISDFEIPPKQPQKVGGPDLGPGPGHGPGLAPMADGTYRSADSRDTLLSL